MGWQCVAPLSGEFGLKRRGTQFGCNAEHGVDSAPQPLKAKPPIVVSRWASHIFLLGQIIFIFPIIGKLREWRRIQGPTWVSRAQSKMADSSCSCLVLLAVAAWAAAAATAAPFPRAGPATARLQRAAHPAENVSAPGLFLSCPWQVHSCGTSSSRLWSHMMTCGESTRGHTMLSDGKDW